MKAAPLKLVLLSLTLLVAACSHENHFKKASPEVQAKTNVQLAIEYMRLNKMSDSRDAIERALTQDPGNAEVQMTAGIVYERINDMPKAERAYSAMYRLRKDDPNIGNTYAGFLCRSGKTAEGEKLFEAVAKSALYQTPEVAFTNAGVCVSTTGDLVDAERYFNRALAIHPDFPEAMLQLGSIELQRGDAGDARDMVLRYLAVNPPSPEILWLGFRASRKLGDNSAAAAYARRVQSEFPSSEQAQMLRSGIDR
jgi:type IV pilus assembly protein PilF